MFGKKSRTQEAERIAEHAWEQLLHAVESAGDTARSVKNRTGSLAGNTTDKVGSVADEAWRRAGGAYDALAGRRRPTPWAWIAGAAAVGAAVAFFAATAGRRAAARAQQEITERYEPVRETPSYVDDAIRVS